MAMGASTMATSKWVPLTFTITVAVISGFCMVAKKWRALESKVRELEASLKSSVDQCSAERQGRIRAQQALRKALLQQKTGSNLELTSYPFIPIGTIQSCFTTRNGTPRQPLVVPLARACLIFDSGRVPPASLEGLEEYTHVWIIYIFHLNTNLEKSWMEPSNSKIKAKVRVPRLNGEKKGVFATRTPHRPSPIGLTVAKVEAVQGNMILLSGVDLVDGTPVLDIKPYLPYCDSIQESAVPDWVQAENLLAVSSVTFSEGFHSALESCWESVEKTTLYSSPNEIKRLIEQVLSWDIRSSSQRTRPHNSILTAGNCEAADATLDAEDCEDKESSNLVTEQGKSSHVIYRLFLEDLAIFYTIDLDFNVVIDTVALPTRTRKNNQTRSNYSMWKANLDN